MLLSRKTFLSKMSHSGRLKVRALLLALVLLEVSAEAVPFQDRPLCPIGFVPSLIDGVGEGCLQIKSHEVYSGKYDRCNGNAMIPDFYKYKNEYAQSKGKETFWTDYVRAYKKGPFINWAIGDSGMGEPLDDTVWKNATDNDSMCSIVSLTSRKLEAARCDDKYSRYCFVKNYNQAEQVEWDCPQNSFTYVSFASPVPACISSLKQRGPSGRRTPYRARSEYLENHCTTNSSHLLHRGYIYTNHIEIGISDNDTLEIPLGITKKDQSLFWKDYNETILPNEWNFLNTTSDINSPFQHVSLVNQTWKLSDDSKLYFNVVCEYFVKPPILKLIVEIINNSLFVTTNKNDINPKDIWCFTDSVTYHPVRVNVYNTSNSAQLQIKTLDDGYYWCLTINTIRYFSKQSMKKLYLKDKSSLTGLHAIMIKYFNNNEFDNKNNIEWIENELQEFLVEYSHQNGLDPLNQPTRSKRLNLKIKRLYDDGSVLLHGYVRTGSIYTSQRWRSFEVIYIRNVFGCDPTNDTEMTGMDIGFYTGSSTNCSIVYMCRGNFNEGGYWDVNTTNSDRCQLSTPGTTIRTTIIPTTTVCPTCQVNDVLDSLNSLLNSSQPLNTSNLQDATNLINELLDIEEDVEIPGQVLQNLDAIVEKIVLPKNETNVKVVQPNIAVVLALRSGDDPVVGIRVDKRDSELSEGTVQVLRKGHKRSLNDHANDDIYIMIPPELNKDEGSKLSFVVFRNDRAFTMNSSANAQRVNSRIISISITNTTSFSDGQYIDIHLRPFTQSQSNESKKCAYWDFNSGSGGNWSTNGCEILPRQNESGMDTCRCYHLTHFAEIIRSSDSKIDGINEYTLSMISTVGCVISLLGLMIIGLTGVLFKAWRSDFSNKIWMHLSASVAILIVTFLVMSMVDFNAHSIIYCIAAGITLHYSVLSSFCWMLVSAVLSYKRLVTVFANNPSHRLLKACIFGWLIPLVPIILLFALDPDNYGKKFAKGHHQKDFCYPTDLGFWLTVFLPVALIVTANTILFIIIIYSVFISSKIQRHGDTKQLFRSVTVSFLLFFLFGLTWIFGLLSENIVMAYLFCITGTVQGLVLFIFFIVGNKKTRDLWCVQLQLREKKKVPLTSSTSRSYPSRGLSNKQSVTLRKMDDGHPTKPRSLSGDLGNIDSRFS